MILRALPVLVFFFLIANGAKALPVEPATSSESTETVSKKEQKDHVQSLRKHKTTTFKKPFFGKKRKGTKAQKQGRSIKMDAVLAITLLIVGSLLIGFSLVFVVLALLLAIISSGGAFAVAALVAFILGLILLIGGLVGLLT